jgi:hypothetical protein
MRRRSFLFLSALALSTAVTGCGHKPPPGPDLAAVHPVHGRVTLPNKTPLRGGIVYFSPTEVSVGGKVRYEGAGLVDAQGNYKIGFANNDAGVAAGEYKVTIQPREDVELPNSNSSRIPAKYREQSSTPLIVTVKEGDNNFDFDLK